MDQVHRSGLRHEVARFSPGARVLGCILQLAESEESARFWWQYAAGAGDPAASSCLYLHHRALGEHAPARWWHDQTELLQNTPSTDHPHTRGEQPDTETDDVPHAVTTALNEVSTTDASLLPTALRTLIATDTTPTRIRNRLQPRPKASKPLIATARRHRTWAWG
ncbi:hypothetical protein [Streptomyces globisporus]|uniref:hypothetical protein n=1 Tax=Streptomyces globisporus TaxID=1908 RepID=UPI003793232B